MKKRMTKKERYIKYLRRTLPNKIWAIGLMLIGWIAMQMSNDATAFVFMSMFAIPTFFSWDRCVY